MTFTRALLRVLLFIFFFFSLGRMSLQAALSFFSLFSFVRCASVLRKTFIFVRYCFVWLMRTFGFGCFCDEFSFSFALRLPI